MLPEGFEFLDETQVAMMADQIEPKLSPMLFIGKTSLPTVSWARKEDGVHDGWSARHHHTSAYQRRKWCHKDSM